MTASAKTNLISVITPTYNRPHYLPLLYAALQEQTWQQWEWLVEDDSAAPSRFMDELSDPRVQYKYSSQRSSIGAKRNALIQSARGEYIAHCDDDDYYAPKYLETMLTVMRERDADLCKLSSFFLLYAETGEFAYWDLLLKTGLHFRREGASCVPIMVTEENNAELALSHMGFGFSYVYKRSVWQECRFPDSNWGEDGPFVIAASQTRGLALLPDRSGLCLHMLHHGNSSRCFPQFILPQFMAKLIFPTATSYLSKLEQQG